jgi:hypothetical protein
MPLSRITPYVRAHPGPQLDDRIAAGVEVVDLAGRAGKSRVTEEAERLIAGRMADTFRISWRTAIYALNRPLVHLYEVKTDTNRLTMVILVTVAKHSPP